MKIIIDLDEIVLLDITLEQYYLLNLIHFKRLDLLVQYTDKYGEFSVSDVETLKRRELVDFEEFKGDISSVKVTEKGSSIIYSFKKENTEKETPTSIDDFCSVQYEKFPAKVKSGGYLVRQGLVGFRLKLKKFIIANSYPLDVIDKAFTTYIEEKRRSGWSYMKLSGYFISKDNESTLASYCESVISNVNQEVTQQAGHMKAL
jgi:hypothetical protein